MSRKYVRPVFKNTEESSLKTVMCTYCRGWGKVKCEMCNAPLMFAEKCNDCDPNKMMPCPKYGCGYKCKKGYRMVDNSLKARGPNGYEK